MFNQINSNLRRVDVEFKEEDMALMLLNVLPESYGNLVTLSGGKTLELGEITGVLLAFN